MSYVHGCVLCNAESEVVNCRAEIVDLYLWPDNFIKQGASYAE